MTFKEEKMYKRILAPLDGSKLAECALEHVKAIAGGCQVGEVILLTVLEPVFIPDEWWANREQVMRVISERDNKEKQNRQKAEEYLAKASEDLGKTGVSVQTLVIEPEDNKQADETILDYAHDNQIDLIIMSTHGRTGVMRWAMGSVADRIVRYARCPVMTISPAGCRK
jgi:nucleotide-binding universal stress UspA family protein